METKKLTKRDIMDRVFRKIIIMEVPIIIILMVFILGAFILMINNKINELEGIMIILILLIFVAIYYIIKKKTCQHLVNILKQQLDNQTKRIKFIGLKNTNIPDMVLTELKNSSNIRARVDIRDNILTILLDNDDSRVSEKILFNLYDIAPYIKII